jgi:hypothetical protein
MEPAQGAAAAARGMTLEYCDLSTEGLVIEPVVHDETAARAADLDAPARDFLDSDRDRPEIVGAVPNLADFSSGTDCNVGAFEIKAQASRCVCVPRNLAFLLPTTAMIIDDLYRHAGAEVADRCQVSLQFFRSGYQKGEQLLFDRIHRHASEGKMVIYVVTAIEAQDGADPRALGTEFYAARVMGHRIDRARRAASPEDFAEKFAGDGVVAAPGGAIIRFSETTLHAAPDITHPSFSNGRIFGGHGRAPLRRSLLNIIASIKQDDGTVYGRTRPPNDHRPSPVTGLAENVGNYRTAAGEVLTDLCPGK